MSSATEYITRKTNIPSHARSKEWKKVDAWLKERAFFMASVNQARTLAQFRSAASKITAGEMSPAEARETLRRLLEKNGYKAAPGLGGTIKDLSSLQRQKISLDTNVKLAQGWALRQESLGDVLHPAWELFRAGAARQPRDWAKKWKEAAQAVRWEGVARNGQMIALTTSPIWTALSRFGHPYPPFDYGSHMRTRLVDLDTCLRIGLVDDPQTLREQMRQAQLSLNDGVEEPVGDWPPDIIEAVQQQLKGLVERVGDTLVMTDPNGTRPYPPDKIGSIITAPFPEGISHLQEKAYRDWVEKSARFDPPSPKDKRLPQGRQNKVSLDEKEDLIRLFTRIESQPSDETLYRALSWGTNAELEEFRGIVEKNGYYSPKPGKLADSFSTSPHNAEYYASQNHYQAVIVCQRHHSAKDLRPLYNAIQPSKQQTQHPVRLEAEHIIQAGVKLRILKTRKADMPDGTRRVTYYVEEES